MSYRILNRRSILATPPQHYSRRWRRRSSLALLVLVMLGFACYRHLTSQARLIGIATTFLQGMTGGEVSIRQMDFSFFGGTTLSGVVVRTPERFDFGPATGPGRVVCEAAAIRLEHQPLSLLLGRFDVHRITAVNPRFQIVYQKATGLSNWQAMLSARPDLPVTRRSLRPEIYLRRCVLRSGTIDGKTLTFAEPVELDVLGVPCADQPGRYDCRLLPIGPDRIERAVTVDLDRNQVRGDLPGVWIRQLMPALPAEYARWCDILELAGQVGPESIELDSQAGGQCTIRLSSVSLSVPIDQREFYGRDVRARRLVRLTHAAGYITFSPQRLTFDVAGRLNDGPCRAWGSIDGYTGPADRAGFQVNLDVQRIAVPDRGDPYVADQVSRLPAQVRKYFKQFDPTCGWIGITGRLGRSPGSEQPVAFHGTVTTDDASGYYDDFPYRAKHIRSVIRMTDEGIFFTVVARRDPSAVFRVEGWVRDGSRWTDADVRVQAVSIPLDGQLVGALPPRFQRLLSHFDLLGQINCDFHLVRTGGTPETGAAPWQWRTTITLRDVAGRYKPFNYMQHDLGGTFSASNGVIDKIDLYSLSPRSSTTIQGRADLREDQPVVDLRVRTRNRELAPDILPALPQAAARVIRETGMAGLFDVDARLEASADTGGQLQCRADVDWRSGRFALAGAPYPFHDVQGHLYIDLPGNQIDIRDVTGRNSSARLQLDGQVHAGLRIASRFDVRLDDLPLDESLLAVLPEPLRKWWLMFRPAGRLDVHSIMNLDAATPDASPAASTAIADPGDDLFASGLRITHQTTLRLKDNRLCWESFPLPVEGVSGTVVLTNDSCRIADLNASHDQGRLRLDGQIRWAADATRADLSLAATNMPLDEPLREAVPWQLRRLWNNWQPAGRFGLDIQRLRYQAGPGRPATWDFDGTLTADLSKLVMSVDVTDAAFSADGSVHIDEADGTLSGRGTLEAQKAVVSLIPITSARADWVKTANGSIRLNDFTAHSLGGSVAGLFEIEPTLQGDRYGVVLTLDKGDPALLGQALTGREMPGLVGTIQTDVRLRGLADQPDTRSGAVNLRMEGQGLYRLPGLLQLATVLKIPVPAEAPDRDAQQVTAKMTLMADKAILDSLELHDRSFLMQGNGLIDLRTHQADLTVVAAKPRNWPNIPLFSEMLEGTVRELVEVHGTGPINDLKFDAKPLRSLQAALQLLASRQHHPKPAKITRPDEIEWQQGR